MKMDEFSFRDLDDEAMMMAVYRNVMRWSEQYKDDPGSMMMIAVVLENQDRSTPVKVANYIRNKGFYCKQMGCHSEEVDGVRQYTYSIGVKRTKFEK